MIRPEVVVFLDCVDLFRHEKRVRQVVVAVEHPYSPLTVPARDGAQVDRFFWPYEHRRRVRYFPSLTDASWDDILGPWPSRVFLDRHIYVLQVVAGHHSIVVIPSLLVFLLALGVLELFWGLPTVEFTDLHAYEVKPSCGNINQRGSKILQEHLCGDND